MIVQAEARIMKTLNLETWGIRGTYFVPTLWARSADSNMPLVMEMSLVLKVG